jgi:hypothetical protein
MALRFKPCFITIIIIIFKKVYLRVRTFYLKISSVINIHDRWVRFADKSNTIAQSSIINTCIPIHM